MIFIIFSRIKIIDKRIKEEDRGNGFILDGYPRTLNQARLLHEIFANQEKELNAVVLLEAPDNIIIERLSGRRKCEKCGRNYNINTLTPPAVEGVCHDCGGKLIQRNDDKPDTIKHRLEVYVADTQPLVEHYARYGVLKRVSVEESIEDNVVAVKKKLGV